MGKALGLAMLLALLLGCQREEASNKGSAAALSGKLTLVGSSTMAPLVSELAKSFQASHPALQFEVQAGGSSRGISDARAGKADIGMASRALGDKERDLVGFSIARDGVCLLVHKDNPVQALTGAQVIGIFGGKIRNWKEVGGSDSPTTVITRGEGFSSLELFTQYFGIKPADIKADATAGENDTGFNAIIGNPDAITFMSVGEAERRAAAGAPIKLLTLDGAAATSQNIRAGKYSLSRSLTFVTRALPSGPAKAFIDFTLSPQAAPIIRKYDFVSYVD